MTPDKFKTRYSSRHKDVLTLIAYADGYCMVRKKGAMPFVMSLKEWLSLSSEWPRIA